MVSQHVSQYVVTIAGVILIAAFLASVGVLLYVWIIQEFQNRKFLVKQAEALAQLEATVRWCGHEFPLCELICDRVRDILIGTPVVDISQYRDQLREVSKNYGKGGDDDRERVGSLDGSEHSGVGR